MPDTVFDRILSGELPAHIVAEDDWTLAFLDIHPVSLGHTLVIPRRPARDLLDIDEPSVMAVARMVRHVARLLHAVYTPAGITVVQSSGAAAGQDVFRYHVHVVPRWWGDHIDIGYTVLKGLDLADVARRLREAEESG